MIRDWMASVRISTLPVAGELGTDTGAGLATWAAFRTSWTSLTCCPETAAAAERLPVVMTAIGMVAAAPFIVAVQPEVLLLLFVRFHVLQKSWWSLFCLLMHFLASTDLWQLLAWDHFGFLKRIICLSGFVSKDLPILACFSLTFALSIFSVNELYPTMLGFNPLIFGIGGYCSTTCATTTTLARANFIYEGLGRLIQSI